MKRQWICVEVACSPESADDLAAEVADAFGVGVEIGGEAIRFYLEGDSLLDEWESRLRSLLDAFGAAERADVSLVPVTPMKYTTSLLPEEDWGEKWKVHFKPLRIGRRFLICPTWEEVIPSPEDRLIRMDPGRAFGTGHHETTRLCLEWIEGWTEARGEAARGSLLDVGTGSGVLAVAAALVGFAPVAGVDNDPEAIEVALENVALNSLSDQIRLQVGTASDVSGRFDVVIANIQSLPLIDMAPVLIQHLKNSGRLVLSGVLVEQSEEVQSAFEACGVRCVGATTDGEWRLLVFE